MVLAILIFVVLMWALAVGVTQEDGLPVDTRHAWSAY